MPTVILIFALLTAQADEVEVNDCHDAEVNQQWGQLIEEAPGDDLLMRLFALRLGLCQLVDAGQLDLDRATAIFEQARRGAARERREEERQGRGQQLTAARSLYQTPAQAHCYTKRQALQ